MRVNLLVTVVTDVSNAHASRERRRLSSRQTEIRTTINRDIIFSTGRIDFDELSRSLECS